MKEVYRSYLERKNAFLLLCCLALAAGPGCLATYDETVPYKITVPKVITLDGSRDSWTFQIEKRLRERGFKIKRMSSQKVTEEKVSDTKTEIYNESSARYVLFLQAYAPNSRMSRCVAGGYLFDYINAELIDVQNNETVMYYSNSGHSEGCFPLSGSIFEEIANAVDNAWK
ncbi:MAG: hypothetical protein U0S49_11510 [Rhodospirillales bacterium]|nr:hypothetical protein [Rhodospirillales bacterium]